MRVDGPHVTICLIGVKVSAIEPGGIDVTRLIHSDVRLCLSRSTAFCCDTQAVLSPNATTFVTYTLNVDSGTIISWPT